jgi:hypothetical protein
MEPLIVLVALPILIGIASELVFRDAKRASLAATLGTAAAICLCVHLLDAHARWSFLAALLVSPLPIACAVATALFLYGHLQEKERRRHPRA